MGHDRARQYVGSAWGISGMRQLETARKWMGLKPGYDFLEIGCGALNAGQFFMHELAVGKYTCVEPNAILHEQSIAESDTLRGNMSSQQPRLIIRDDFDPRLDIQPGFKFDRTWSHSVLSHAADWQLMQYFEVMAAVLKPSTGVAWRPYYSVTQAAKPSIHRTILRGFIPQCPISILEKPSAWRVELV